MLAFGPVPSRRLGRSLGINNIPPKACTYSCLYCQVGPTRKPEVEPRAFHGPDRIVAEVGARLEKLVARGEQVDFLTFVPDGEPTLDVQLSEAIDALRRFHLPVAVITNSSLLTREDVRDRLRRADWVSVKVDAAVDDAWRAINRRHPALDLRSIREGRRAFADVYSGELVTETMLLDGINDAEDAVRATAGFVASLAPTTAYLAIPTRPAAHPDIRPASETAVARAYAVFRDRFARVETLTGYEGSAFGATGDLEADLLGTTSVHPMRREQVRDLVYRAGGDWSVVERLVSEGALRCVELDGHVIYVRSFPRGALR